MELDEETDGKIRRNLVVASTLILLLTWLEIPLPTITEKLISSTKALPLNPFKVWSACFLVLLYLALRYRFSGEWELFAKSYSGEAWHKRNLYILQIVAKGLKRYHEGGAEAPIFSGALSSAMHEENTKMLRGSDKTSLHRPLGHPQGLQQTDTQWAGVFAVSYTWPLDHPRMASTGGTLPYKVEGMRKWIITIKSYIATSVYSQSSVRYLVPCMLAAAAFVAVLVNLLRAL